MWSAVFIRIKAQNQHVISGLETFSPRYTK